MDFFNPKIRRELEQKDEERKKQTGFKGAAPGGDEWVWLTSYCRIPVRHCFLFYCRSRMHIFGLGIKRRVGGERDLPYGCQTVILR